MLRKVFLTLYAFVIGKIFFLLIASGGAVEESARETVLVVPWYYYFELFVLLLPFAFLVRRGILSSLGKQIPWVAMLAYGVVSISWSLQPRSTIDELLRLTSITAMAAYVARLYDWRVLSRLWIKFVLLVLILSIVAVFLAPNYGLAVGVHEGRWQGVFTHKNQFGRFAALALVSAFAMRGIVSANLLRLTGVLALVSLAGAESVNAIAASILAVPIVVLVQLVGARSLRASSRVIIVVALALFFFVVGVYVANDLGAVLALFGRDTSLTGRTTIWITAIDAAEASPYVGYGAGAFWVNYAQSLPVTFDLIPHAHNGVLELMLDYGAFGALLFGIFLIRAYVQAGRAGIRQAVSALMIFLLISNIAEASLMKPTLLLLVILVSAFYAARSNEIASIRRYSSLQPS